jgi:diguanylate cyclase (GGDEF)-like protein
LIVERRVRRQNAASAYSEKRRAKILEDINASRPLAETIEDVTELVSARLGGAACWCQIADGAKLGNPPARGISGLRVVEKKFRGRSGADFGTLYAAFAARAKPSPIENDTLVLAAGLAILAIETSRLYSDLVHRSEFDLLTDVHNRFSLENFLDAQIRLARQSAGAFGLLYIDLDRFKEVNDEYGHHVGDLYLKEAAVRMKQQLRPGDLLARLGGDEFAAVVLQPQSRAHVKEIAMRLERSFDEPFHCDGQVLHGAASVGFALYPEDGTTREKLLMAADEAMYVQKNAHSEGSLSAAQKNL